MRMTSNTAQVDQKLGRIQEDILERLYSRFVHRLTLDAYRRIVYMTPRKTGRAQSSWDVSLLTPSDFSPPEGAETYSAADVGKALAAIQGIRLGDDVWITSNLVYIRRLNDGSSQQAPAQFVEQGLMEALSVLRRSA